MKSGDKSVAAANSENQGIDFLMVLQIGGGIACAIIAIWLIFHNILHII